MVFDRRFQAELDHVTGTVRQAMLDDPATPFDLGRPLHRRARVTPPSNWPKLLTRALPAPLAYVETQDFDPGTRTLHVRTLTNIFPDQIHVKGALFTRPHRSGQILRIWEGSCHCSLPLLGPRIEQAIIRSVQLTFAKSAILAHAWLTRSSP